MQGLDQPGPRSGPAGLVSKMIIGCIDLTYTSFSIKAVL